MAEKMGTLSWARKNGGRLGFIERLAVVANIARLQAGHMIDRMRRRSGAITPIAIDPCDVPIPDTRLVEDALAIATECQSLPLLYHAWRVYFFGYAFGRFGRLSFDPELLIAACLLHDIGLTHAADVTPLEQCCFAVSGGRYTREKLAALNHPPEKIALISDAISLHLNLIVPAMKHGGEAHLLARGACCDVFGSGKHRIARSTINAIHRIYPRNGVFEALRFESARHMPGSRAAVMGGLFGHKAPPDAFVSVLRSPVPEHSDQSG